MAKSSQSSVTEYETVSELKGRDEKLWVDFLTVDAERREEEEEMRENGSGTESTLLWNASRLRY